MAVKETRPPLPDKSLRGNVLFMVLIAIAVLAMLTLAISQSSTEQSSILPQQTIDDQINRTITYASALGGAVQQMAVNGENPATLYSSLSLLKPGDANFETAPNNFKIYHPLGGGITYITASSPDPNAVATSFSINPGAIITGVGATDAVIGDIVFTAKISAANYCAETNKILNGSTTVPTMDSATFTSLFGGTTVTVTSGLCAACVNKARLCVTDGSSHWGFYAALFPG